jgi:hypothetical protein
MSTLIEIEAAVDQLPYPEQEILLEHLARKLGMWRPQTEVHGCDQKVARAPISSVALRSRNQSLQQILDDIRAEDCW